MESPSDISRAYIQGAIHSTLVKYDHVFLIKEVFLEPLQPDYEFAHSDVVVTINHSGFCQQWCIMLSEDYWRDLIDEHLHPFLIYQLECLHGIPYKTYIQGN